MVTERTRTLLGPADPARTVTVPDPALPAACLIARANAGQDQLGVGAPPRPSRRMALVVGVAATLVVATGATAVLLAARSTAPAPRPQARPGHGPSEASSDPANSSVVAPVAYQLKTNAPAAHGELLALAKSITDAPYDSHSGRYVYCRTRIWGDPLMISPDGRYSLGYASEDETWTTKDGSGWQRTQMLAPQFPDEQSRDFYASQPGWGEMSSPRPPHESSVPEMPGGLAPLPNDQGSLRTMLGVTYGPAATAKGVDTLYSRYAMSRSARAMTLEILADVPGFVWRGEVTDRAGRRGVAITANTDSEQVLLVFDPATGALLAHERVALEGPAVTMYALFLGYDRTDQHG